MDRSTRLLVGVGGVLAPSLHVLTDVLEVVGGGFSTVQLAMNYLAFLAMPFVMIGLYAIQRPRIGPDGLIGALTYGAAFVYFAGTALYAAVRPVRDYATLLVELGWVYGAHGVLMVFGGILFGSAVVRAGVLPRWTGAALIAGVSINAAVALLYVPPIFQVVGSVVRNVALVAMGTFVIRLSNETVRQPGAQ